MANTIDYLWYNVIVSIWNPFKRKVTPLSPLTGDLADVLKDLRQEIDRLQTQIDHLDESRRQVSRIERRVYRKPLDDDGERSSSENDLDWLSKV